jgi:hypothetical protein
MNSEIESLVAAIRKSVVDELETANSLYDIVAELSESANQIPDENVDVKKALENHAIKIFQKASQISDNASSVGKKLAYLIGRV